MEKKRYCPCCGFELDSESWQGKHYRCPMCGIEGTRKETLASSRRKKWKDGYDEDWLKQNGYAIMTSPEEAGIVGLKGFKSNAWLIADDEGMTLYGRYAYVYKKDWYESVRKEN